MIDLRIIPLEKWATIPTPQANKLATTRNFQTANKLRKKKDKRWEKRQKMRLFVMQHHFSSLSALRLCKIPKRDPRAAFYISLSIRRRWKTHSWSTWSIIGGKCKNHIILYKFCHNLPLDELWSKLCKIMWHAMDYTSKFIKEFNWFL